MDKNSFDIRDSIFKNISEYTVTSAISNRREGIVAGIKEAICQAEQIGLDVLSNVQDGMFIEKNETIMMLRGTPKQTAIAEEMIIGTISKLSGIATAAKKAKDLSEGKVDIVSGSIKKMPKELRLPIRHAILPTGVKIRIAEPPFIYLDKNYIKMFGSIENALKEVSGFSENTIVVQLKDENGGLDNETRDACVHGADILMIDTGKKEDIKRVLEVVNTLNIRSKIKIAFAGNVRIDEIPDLCETGIDIICIGRDIVDAPLLDMSLDVIDIQESMVNHNFEMNLLEKSELWIEKIMIDHVNLNEIAQAVAAVLLLKNEDVLVVDVRSDHITLDILRKTIDVKQVAGKEQEILQAISQIKGVHISEESFIHSNGVLGLIALDNAEADEVIENTVRLGEAVKNAFNHRACIFPTGFEVQQKMIEDTNSPYIVKELRKLNYQVEIKEALSDDLSTIRCAIEEAMYEGYSLIITTGGVGAEDKDYTVEAVLKIDPNAATPWLVKFQKGTGRHKKEGIRIAVGEIQGVRLICLPGPNDEVRRAMEVLAGNLDSGFNKYRIAQKIAEALREKVKKEWAH